MRKVRFNSVKHLRYTDLTVGKVYDVIRDMPYDMVALIDDNGEENWFFTLNSKGVIALEDVTIEYRDQVIDSILN